MYEYRTSTFTQSLSSPAERWGRPELRERTPEEDAADHARALREWGGWQEEVAGGGSATEALVEEAGGSPPLPTRTGLVRRMLTGLVWADTFRSRHSHRALAT